MAVTAADVARLLDDLEAILKAARVLLGVDCRDAAGDLARAARMAGFVHGVLWARGLAEGPTPEKTPTVPAPPPSTAVEMGRWEDSLRARRPPAQSEDVD